MVRRLLMFVLDGYDPRLGEELAGRGDMPTLAALRRRAARFDLDHGDARWTGLAGEHVSTGLSPADARRWSAVHFDSRSYAVRQLGTALAPFPAALSVKTVVFNPTYFDLSRAPTVRGVVGWGGIHDPGAAAAARPAGLAAEIDARFGPDPGKSWTYALTWPSEARTNAMGDALAAALAQKERILPWLLGERLPDWQLAIVGIGEIHSALEAMWHGLDPEHPLAGAASAAASKRAVHALYRAADRLIGRLAAAFPEAGVAIVAPHGMGSNTSDLPAMALLPELLCRRYRGFGRIASPAPDANEAALAPEEEWAEWLRGRFRPPAIRRWSRYRTLLPWRRASGPESNSSAISGDVSSAPIDWMPAAWYAADWPRMHAFALPSFYDSRVRINLAGREAQGRVRMRNYAAACEEIEALVGACRDLRTGASVAARIERAAPADPNELAPTGADIVVHWRPGITGFRHPTLGSIGPLPFRRTGGHTGGYGVAYIAAHGIAAGEYGVHSGFDIVPTVIDLLGEAPVKGLSGRSLLSLAAVSTPGADAKVPAETA
ncbi:MAG: alkaline phosphatase family protein [Rhodospirillaceae bacterium]|nr:alkaline phosphatase family protein [Rhodospirillaceae bacterium]